MALAEIPAKGQASWRGWDWRGEFSLAVATLRSSYPYTLALLALILVTLAYQVGDAVGVQIGGGYDQPYVRNFQERDSADGQTFRWATDRSRVLLPGAGAINSTLFITAAPRPDGVLAPVQVVVNGIDLGKFTPEATLHTFQFALPANDYSYGDLTVDLISAPQLVPGKGRDPVPFGPKITEVRAVRERRRGLRQAAAEDAGGLVPDRAVRFTSWCAAWGCANSPPPGCRWGCCCSARGRSRRNGSTSRSSRRAWWQ